MYVNLKDATHLSFSSCHECQSSCCNGSRFMLAPLILNDLQDVYERFLIAFAYIDEKLRMVMLISNRKKPCIYYQEGLCTIYESRPPACVLYPFTPFYDELLIDTACDAVGSEGFLLQADEREGTQQIHPSFFHQRVENFFDKLKATERFLEGLDSSFEPILELDGVTLMHYVGTYRDDAIKMHHDSMKHLDRWL